MRNERPKGEQQPMQTAQARATHAAERLAFAESLFKAGRASEAAHHLADFQEWVSEDVNARALVLQGVALFEIGEINRSLDILRLAMKTVRGSTPADQFSAAFALFVRAADFQTPTGSVPDLARLRQLAAWIGDSRSLAGLHLAVARLEGSRGHCVDAHRHVEIARKLSGRVNEPSLTCHIDLVEASLESVAGNLIRSRNLAMSSQAHALALGNTRYLLSARTLLSLNAIHRGDTRLARLLLPEVLDQCAGFTYVTLAALDNLAQLELLEGNLEQCESLLLRASDVAKACNAPMRYWNDFDNDVTRCAFHERTENWNRVLEIVDAADAELERRQFKAIRTSLLCARARAFARLGRHDKADATLAAAVRGCPRGAIDPLIVLEGSKGLCLSLRGDRSQGMLHFDRALAACHAIGHRYHQAWIERQRADVAGPVRAPASPSKHRVDLAETSLLLSDVATALGAGHSIDLLAHRTASILRNSGLGSRVDVESLANQPYCPMPSGTWDAGADGSFEIRLRGSDRREIIRVRGVTTLDEVSLLKSVADIVQAAVNRTADTESDDDGQNLWPQTLPVTDDETVFQSPRMVELLEIAARLATTDLPVLITGETGTGKEILARWIHERSLVRQGPFVPFNCSAIPRELVESQLFGHRRGAFTGAMDSSPGVIRAAERGTLFLDEIGDLDAMTQPKLLRFLESGEIHPVGEMRAQKVKTRILAATNADLEQLVEQGRFRADLLYRIDVAAIALPPLRERKDEIPALAELFLKRYATECNRTGLRLADDFIAALLLHDWPGNIRQLANEVRRVVAMAADGDSISSRALAPAIAVQWNDRPTSVTTLAPEPSVTVRLDQPLANAIGDLEEQFIQNALDATGGRVSDAAKLLGLSRKGLFLKRRRHGIGALHDDDSGSTQS